MSLESEGGSGEDPVFPSYDLFPSDYLEFADQEIKSYKETSDIKYLINSILHLRRALDCQIDIFLFVFRLTKITEKRNLGMTSKLTFLKEARIVNSRVLDRFNRLRNIIEHDYKIPEISDIEVYFDLITSFISNIELAIFSITSHCEVILAENASIRYEYKQSFVMSYNFNEPAIEYEINKEDGTIIKNKIIPEQINLYAKFFKILYLLIRKHSMISEKSILKEL